LPPYLVFLCLLSCARSLYLFRVFVVFGSLPVPALPCLFWI